MWKWLTNRASNVLERAVDDQTVLDRRADVASGKYRVLYEYLEHRFANVIVLTFSQIEDLLGFALPQRARIDGAWWTLGENVEGAPHADAWTLAGRTATPNLNARTVSFERESTPRPGRRSPSRGGLR